MPLATTEFRSSPDNEMIKTGFLPTLSDQGPYILDDNTAGTISIFCGKRITNITLNNKVNGETLIDQSTINIVCDTVHVHT